MGEAGNEVTASSPCEVKIVEKPVPLTSPWVKAVFRSLGQSAAHLWPRAELNTKTVSNAGPTGARSRLAQGLGPGPGLQAGLAGGLPPRPALTSPQGLLGVVVQLSKSPEKPIPLLLLPSRPG